MIVLSRLSTTLFYFTFRDASDHYCHSAGFK